MVDGEEPKLSDVPTERIQDQLKKILSSTGFASSSRLRQFLRYVVDETLAGHTNQIKQYSVGVEAMGFGPEFNPESNPTVRIHAHKLRRALDYYYHTDGSGDRVRIDIPKGTYIPVFHERDIAPEMPDALDGPSPTTTTTEGIGGPAVAVYGFENLNKDEDSAFIARGLTAEILIGLTKFVGLTVLGPLNLPSHEPNGHFNNGNRYDFPFELRGTVRRHKSQIRITTDLTDALNGEKLWGKTFGYDIEETSLFEIEDDVTSRIIGVIADDLGIIFRKLTDETYHEHLRIDDITRAILAYNAAWITQSPADWIRANDSVEEALTRHPESALLIALQANIFYADALYTFGMTPQSVSRMEALANRAVSLDPDLQIAQYNLVVISAFFGKKKRCTEQAAKVAAMNPNNARILSGCAVATTSVGAYEMGREFIGKAQRLNPHYPGWYHLVEYIIHFREGRYEEAWTEAQKIHVEGLLWHPIFRGSILGKLGRAAEAQPYIEDLLQIKPDFLEHPRDYIRRLLVLDEHVEMIWDGLQMAGMTEVSS